MYYAAIKKTDVANGPGVRVSLFVSGCTHRCKGCFNSEAWDFHYGREYTEETEQEILQALSPDYIRGLSVLGGEPMEPENRGTVHRLLRAVRRQFPDKDIWCYTGYDYEEDLLRWGGRGTDSDKGAAEENGSGADSPGNAKTQEAVPEGIKKRITEAKCPEIMEILSMTDVLVDGKFVEEQKNLRLAFRGSGNQRLIDVQASLRQGKTVCLPEC